MTAKTRRLKNLRTADGYEITRTYGGWEIYTPLGELIADSDTRRGAIAVLGFFRQGAIDVELDADGNPSQDEVRYETIAYAEELARTASHAELLRWLTGIDPQAKVDPDAPDFNVA